MELIGIQLKGLKLSKVGKPMKDLMHLSVSKHLQGQSSKRVRVIRRTGPR